MRLLYWYTQFLTLEGAQRTYRGMNNFELNLSATDRFEYDPENHEFTCTPLETPLPPDFWGKKIYNVNVLTGSNGVGKSSIIGYMMDCLNELYQRNLKSYDFTIFVMDIDGVNHMFILNGHESSDIKVLASVEKHLVSRGQLSGQSSILYPLERSKIIYMSNTLNHSDDRRAIEEILDRQNWFRHVRKRFIYDCSVSGAIRFDQKDDCHASKERDLLVTYFTNEHYKQVKYICDRKQYSNLLELRNDGKPVPIPKSLRIDLHYDVSEYLRNHLINLSKLEKLKSDYSEFDLVSFSLCVGCLLAFEQNLRNIYSDYQAPEDRYSLSSVGYEVVAELFSNAKDALLYPAAAVDSEEKSIEISVYDEAEEMYSNCLSFVSFLFDESTKLKTYFNVLNTFDSIIPIPDSFEVDMTSEAKTDFEWFLEFMRLYKQTCVPYYFLDFSWGLSSGENNLLSMFSSLYYVFDGNDDHIVTQSYATDEQFFADTILLFMDEADLTYHPEWQRQFVSILTAFLSKVYDVRKIKNIQVLLTTHSPLLLSDMPKNNVIYLQKDDMGKPVDIETFGQNIHQILKDSFFLENGTIGAFAADKINETARRLQNIIDEFEKQGQQKHHDFERINRELEECKQLIDLVAPGVLKGKLILLYREASGKVFNSAHGEVNQAERRKAHEMSNQQLEAYLRMYQDELNRRSHDD